MSDQPENYYELRLMREIGAINRNIEELQEEKRALERQLKKARWENHTLKDVTRKNSANRVMVESRVLEALRRTREPMVVAKLYQEARIMVPNLKEATFRTHLHRMKGRELIVNVKPGVWKIADQD